jgi:hypothetical protein
MLFDLRSPRRRRVIKGVYLFLAVLIGVGLVGFGVGTGGNFGGLLSSAGGGGGTATGQTTLLKALATAEKKAKVSPTDPAAWATVGRSAYVLATLPTNYDSSLGYTTTGHAYLTKLKHAWVSYLSLAPAKPDQQLAAEVVAAFGTPPTGIGDYRTAETAQEIVTENQGTYTQYEYLAYYAYLANELTPGDQAAARAIALAPKSLVKQVKTALTTMRGSAQARIGGATGPSGSTTGTTGATGSTGATG